MEYLIALAAAAVLAFSFALWEPSSVKDGTCARRLCITGILAHLGGAGLVGISGGPLAGIVAALGIPVAGAVIYSLLVAPVGRDRGLRTRGSLTGVGPARTSVGR